MQKAQFEINQIKSLFPKFQTPELEDFLREIKRILKSREPLNKKQKEVQLIQKLNETALPKENLERYIFLHKKRKQSDLSEVELAEMSDLIDEELELQTKRVYILGELSELKGVPIIELAKQLGIKPPPSV